jgi:hypothetical protein
MWDSILNILSFTGVEDKSVWQDIFFTVLLIPLAILLVNNFLAWWNSKKPASLIFKNYLDKDKNIFIFHSQMSGADKNYIFNPNQKYITRYPDPLPTNQNNLVQQNKCNIDPVLSKAEMECLADIYNMLGRVGKIKKINIGDLINDWDIWSDPIFSVGFNPKTHKLIEKCSPIYFKLNSQNDTLTIKNKNITYGCISPNDAGIVQKTFIKDSNSPVFILAGLGTMGTSAAGYILKQNFIKIGKLFGSNPFCIFLKVKIDEGKTLAFIDKIYPKPNWHRIILYPLTYYKFRKKNIFKFKEGDRKISREIEHGIEKNNHSPSNNQLKS